MAKTIKSRAEYQVTELVNNLNQAATTNSEQKRDFFTTKAMYNARRLSTLISKAKIGALGIALAFVMASCGSSASTEAPAASTDAAATTAPSADTATVAVVTDSTAK